MVAQRSYRPEDTRQRSPQPKWSPQTTQGMHWHHTFAGIHASWTVWQDIWKHYGCTGLKFKNYRLKIKLAELYSDPYNLPKNQWSSDTWPGIRFPDVFAAVYTNVTALDKINTVGTQRLLLTVPTSHV